LANELRRRFWAYSQDSWLGFGDIFWPLVVTELLSRAISVPLNSSIIYSSGLFCIRFVIAWLLFDIAWVLFDIAWVLFDIAWVLFDIAWVLLVK
jgi:hypothetical protein